MRYLAPLQASKRAPILQVLKSAVATVAAWLVVSLAMGIQLPIFAAIAALLVVQPSVNQSLSKAVERSIGVVAGVVIASVISALLGSASWVVLVSIGVAMLVAWLLRVTPGTGNQVAISAMLVLALGGDSPNYALDRILETLIGAAIGIVVNALVVPPVLVAPAVRDASALGADIAASLDRLADALGAEQSPADLDALMEDARSMRAARERAEKSIAQGAESLTLNPRRSSARDRLELVRTLMDERLRPMVTQVVGMTRAFCDHYAPSLHEEPAARDIAEQLRRAAHDVRLALHLAEVDTEPPTSAIPALTAPLVLAPPRSGHWILIGSLMEDLRRVREELLGDAER